MRIQSIATYLFNNYYAKKQISQTRQNYKSQNTSFLGKDIIFRVINLKN